MGKHSREDTDTHQIPLDVEEVDLDETAEIPRPDLEVKIVTPEEYIRDTPNRRPRPMPPKLDESGPFSLKSPQEHYDPMYRRGAFTEDDAAKVAKALKGEPLVAERHPTPDENGPKRRRMAAATLMLMASIAILLVSVSLAVWAVMYQPKPTCPAPRLVPPETVTLTATPEPTAQP